MKRKRKEKRKEKKERRKRPIFFLNYHTPSHNPKNLTYFHPISLLFYSLFLKEKITI